METWVGTPAYSTDCVFWANLYAPISHPNIAMLPVIMLACGNQDIPSDLTPCSLQLFLFRFSSYCSFSLSKKLIWAPCSYHFELPNKSGKLDQLPETFWKHSAACLMIHSWIIGEWKALQLNMTERKLFLGCLFPTCWPHSLAGRRPQWRGAVQSVPGAVKNLRLDWVDQLTGTQGPQKPRTVECQKAGGEEGRRWRKHL